MTSITDLAQELKEDTEWQKTPDDVSMESYEKMILRGIRRLLVDTGRASIYNESLIKDDDDIDTDDIFALDYMNGDMEGNIFFDYDFQLDEIEYILLCAKIAFFKKVQSDVNNIVGYTTDALTVTNADKPYANLKDTIDDLQNERRIVFYKMVRYVVGDA